MGFEYGQDNRWYDQYFDRTKSIASASFVCTNPLAVGEHHGALAVTVAASGDVSIASGKSFKLTIQGSDTEDGTFNDVAGAPEVSVSGGLSEVAKFADGDTICKLVLPDMQRYAKIRVTSDATNSGNVDVYLSYLAR